MTRLLTVLALVAVLTFTTSVSASTVIGLDFVAVENGAPVFVDDFDNGVLDQPPWFIATGAPGPEAGTTLQMQGGDTILAGLGGLNPALDTVVQAQADLLSFPADSLMSLLLFDDTAPIPQALVLAVIPDAAFLVDGIGTLLGYEALDPGSTASLSVTVGANGVVSASVNTTPIFCDEFAFGMVSGIGIAVIPEPATLVLLGAGLAGLALRRRNR